MATKKPDTRPRWAVVRRRSTGDQAVRVFVSEWRAGIDGEALARAYAAALGAEAPEGTEYVIKDITPLAALA